MTRLNATMTLVITLGLLAPSAASAEVKAAQSPAGAATPNSSSNADDFRIAADRPRATVGTKGHVRFTVTFTSVGGFRGEVRPELPEASAPPGATIKWRPSQISLPPNGSADATLTILAVTTPPGVYQIAPQGVSGSVTHAVAPAIVLTVTQREPITATLSPDRPIVGVSGVRISGRGATPGEGVIDTSTFPDGVSHQFVAIANGAGTYTIGPFALRQLGTFHDVVRDPTTGTTTEISYEGVGDFRTSVDRTSETVARGEEAKFVVTFKSLSGFAGAVKPAVPDLSRIAGATASWSSPAVTVPNGESAMTTVPSGDSISVGLTIKTSSATSPGAYKINVQGTNGSVTHTAPSEIELTVKE
jgi:hypothetical protein